MRSKWYQCYTDEHYFATVLALYGHERETDCLGHSVAADWSVQSSHPHSYEPEEVTATLCGFRCCSSHITPSAGAWHRILWKVSTLTCCKHKLIDLIASQHYSTARHGDQAPAEGT